MHISSKAIQWNLCNIYLIYIFRTYYFCMFYFQAYLCFHWATLSCFLLVSVTVVSSFNEPKGWCVCVCVRKARVCFQMAVNVLAGWIQSQWGDHYNAADEASMLPEETTHWSASLLWTARHYGRLAGCHRITFESNSCWWKPSCFQASHCCPTCDCFSVNRK